MQAPRSWLGRAAFALLIATGAVLAFFFIVVFLAIGAVLVTGLLVRWWWIVRRIRRARVAESIEGEYVVVPARDAPVAEREPESPRALPHSGRSQ